MMKFLTKQWIAGLLTGVLIFGCQSSNKKGQSKSGTESDGDTTQVASPITLNQSWELTEGIQRPESAVYDTSRNMVYISNMAGGASEKNGNGYIAKITPGGKMMETKWIGGLNAPKGLAISGDNLYAADIDELVQINLKSGEITNRYPAGNAQFLNDVTADTAGNVYVSDSRTSTVYRLHDGNFEVWLQGKQIKSPNGLYAEPGRLVIAACGIKSEDPGSDRYLQAINYNTKEVSPIGKMQPIGELDAVQPNGRGGYFLTDWGAGKVMNYNETDGSTLLRQISQGTADLDYITERQMIILPVMMSDRVLAFEVEY